jgi:2-polyprenyl-6-methoxyphenol hydroxylase-like FAD-dependent oxidoreductase
MIETGCCIVGGGPAGMMLGFLLARAGLDIVVLEKHADFLRDFRGDTIHPSTLELMHELGLLDDFIKLPHERAEQLSGRYGDMPVTIADFRHLPTQCKYIALMPQWDFLNFLADRGRRYKGFRLLMSTEATGLMEEGGRTIGVRARAHAGEIEIRAALVVGCDGRHSTLREQAHFQVEELGAPMDVEWFRLSRRPEDPSATGGLFLPGRIFVMLNRGDFWQCAYVIPKDGDAEMRRKGLAAFRAGIVSAVPLFANRVDEIADWDQVKLLTVSVDRMPRWYRSGLLFIGDAAHAMSPIGGVGVNLAVQDAVAAANILAGPLLSGAIGDEVLAKVQERREFPTRVTQRIQVLMQNNIIRTVLSGEELKPPLPLRLLAAWPLLRRLPARLLGLGVRPEHIRTPERA